MSEEGLLETAGPAGAVLRLRFFRAGDRFAHRLELAEGDSIRPLLESLEGTAAEDWPASPPLQQLHVEERPTGKVALLVGMAGRSHWSLAVETAPNGFLFRAACRLREPPAKLGSRYRLLHPAGESWVTAETPSADSQSAVTSSALIRDSDRAELRPTAEFDALPQRGEWGFRLGGAG